MGSAQPYTTPQTPPPPGQIAQTPSGVQPWYSYNDYPEYAHDGTSLGVPFHTPITAPFAGTVVRSSYGDPGGQVDIRMRDGTTYSFVHLDWIDPKVKVGQTVTPGQYIGLSGGENPGYPGALHPATPQYSTGAHIDFDIWSGQAWNSTPLVQQSKQAIYGLRTSGLPTGAGPSVTPGATLDNPSAASSGCTPPQNWWDWPAYSLCIAGRLMQNQGIANPGDVFSSVPDALGAIVNFITTLAGFLFNPIRIVKVLGGATLVIISLVIAFREDIAAGGAAALGIPVAAARNPIGGGVRLLGGKIGRERREASAAAASQRAQAAGYAINQNIAAQRAATTRRLQARQMQAQAAKTQKLQTKAQAGNGYSPTPYPGGVPVYDIRGNFKGYRTPKPAPPNPRVNFGKYGYGGWGAPRTTPPTPSTPPPTPNNNPASASAPTSGDPSLIKSIAANMRRSVSRSTRRSADEVRMEGARRWLRQHGAELDASLDALRKKPEDE